MRGLEVEGDFLPSKRDKEILKTELNYVYKLRFF